jgi:hypothetical protein
MGGSFGHNNKASGSIKSGEFRDRLSDCQLLIDDCMILLSHNMTTTALAVE